MPRTATTALLAAALLMGCTDEDSSPVDGPGGSGGGTATGTGTGVGTGGAGPTGGCFAASKRPPTVAPSGIAMPSLEDERETYRALGWTWAPEAEPDVPADPAYAVTDPDIHGDTEGDDLWTYLLMHQRTNEDGYLDRATAWARYFKEDYRSCVGGEYASYCYDRDGFGLDHLFGWGLVAWSETTGDADALAEAERIAEELEALWGPNSDFGCLPSNACTNYGTRQVGRHLLFMTRVADVTGADRWTQLRDQIIDTVLGSADWDAERGMYFYGEWSTDEALGPGAYAAGARLASPFQIGVLSEAFDQAYRATGREQLRERMVAMAGFVDTHGLDPTYDYAGSSFGILDGAVYHNYAASDPVDFWDPVYTTSFVNTLVRGYRYTCDEHFLDRAAHFFERGNKGIYGEPTERAAPDGVVHHFVDTVFASAHGDFYLDYNKGELQYTYLLFARP